MKSEIMTVTPEVAAKWLEENNHNRRIRQSAVDLYAADMVAGKWKLNGASIAFGKSGRLLDGQHRLFACVMSGQSFDSVVVTGLDESVFTTIDQGRFRNPGDHLKIAGHDTGYLQNRYASSLNIIHNYDQNSVSYNTRILPDEVIDAATQNQGLELWFPEVHSNLPKGLKGFAAQISAVTWVAQRNGIYAGRARDFFDQLSTGIGLEAGSPILALRNRIMNDPPTEKMYRFYIVVTSWNHYAKGQKLFKIAPTKDRRVPTIVGDLKPRQVIRNPPSTSGVLLKVSGMVLSEPGQSR